MQSQAMRTPLDPLYKIFERYLYNSFLDDENHEDFIAKVVEEYLAHMQQVALIPAHLLGAVENDLKEEVTEMLRKKIYGHFNLKAFRKANSEIKKPTDSPQVNHGRAFRPRPRNS